MGYAYYARKLVIYRGFMHIHPFLALRNTIDGFPNLIFNKLLDSPYSPPRDTPRPRNRIRRTRNLCRLPQKITSPLHPRKKRHLLLRHHILGQAVGYADSNSARTANAHVRKTRSGKTLKHPIIIIERAEWFLRRQIPGWILPFSASIRPTNGSL